jgi:predicted phage baseplate assembly protein
MPLPLPNLDDRRWADLVEEGRALIPRYAPEWTDHNVHDPGITLIELFAWLAEQDIYRLNRVPERHRRKFLALIGFNPEPSHAARTMLSFIPDAGTGAFKLPAGVEFEGASPDGQPVPFRTLRDLTVAEAKLAAVQVGELNVEGNLIFRDRTRDWRDGLPIAALGLNPQPGESLYLGFSELPAEVPIALAFHFQGPGNDARERARIIREAAVQGAACRPVLPAITCKEQTQQPEQLEDRLPPHHSAQLVWEVYTTNPEVWTRLEPVENLARPNIGQVMDDTRSLTLDGIVEVNLPLQTAQTKLGKVPDPLFYLRCRLVAGAYDAPPRLVDIVPNSVVAEQAVQGHGDKAPAAVTGQVPTDLIQVGVGTGQPGQRVALKQAPVQIESFRLYTYADNTLAAWKRHEDLDASGRTDYHFILDATHGEITFGDGNRGRVPPSGALILGVYRTTRAEGGNIDANKVIRLAATPRNDVLLGGLSATARAQLSRIMTNHMPASGGAAAETLAAATGRAVETLHAHERLVELCAETKCQTLDQIDRNRVRSLRSPTRGVNLLDVERIALDVPGTRIARARAWAGIHPAYPCLQAPGVVTVVIVPDMPVAKPKPSKGLLEAVRRYLDRRRLVTTRLEVVGPKYLEVQVRARVRTHPYTDTRRVRDAIHQALDAFLDPRSGGPNRLGWPFGRDAYRSEILQLIDGVPGVDHVLELTLSAGTGVPRCGNLSLCPTELVTPGKHAIEVL